jgi:hypothetical protein
MVSGVRRMKTSNTTLTRRQRASAWSSSASASAARQISAEAAEMPTAQGRIVVHLPP